MSEAPKRNPRRLEDSSVLITGGTSGVGLATAIQFAEAGVPNIGINGRNRERGEAARKAVLAKVPTANVEFFAGDANELDQATAVTKGAEDAFGRIDVLVNATVTAYPIPTLFHEIDLKELPAMVLSHVMAPLNMCGLVLPGMREREGGSIINIASDAGKLTTPGESVIGGMMAAIIMFSRAFAMEAKRNGIRVNVITPSIIEGTLTHDQVMNAPFSRNLFAKAMKMAQLGVTQPDDLAAMIVFLSSPQGANITGQAISVNGGISAA
ncbi:MAG: SDR family oxidoreductase [Rhodobiaceae bacterium]|nr:SDR family oxidoreductase [Rhodobiaceae bacterium]MCC0054511.1 SDR family oxidoreductase [Rhodobiaceae bacterium]